MTETVLVIGAAALAWWRPAMFEGFWNGVEIRLRGLKLPAAFLIAFLLPLLIRAVLLPVVGIPKPNVMDEFSYLLGGETFAMGRISNPAPPVPEAFRAPYILTSPRYVSIYPPAQAMVLAFGQVAFGHPWWGIFLSIGVMAATTLWMSRAFVPDRWAFAGALLAGLQLGTFTYWMNSYWGGSLSAIGGNLVVGAYGRLRTRMTAGPAWAFTGGAVLLGLRRPYEGLVLVLIVCCLLAHDLLVRQPQPRWSEFRRFLGPVVSGLLVFGIATAWYNQQCTGNWRSFPYSVGVRQTTSAPQFLFERLHAEPKLPDNMERFETGYRLETYRRERTLDGYLATKAAQFRRAFWIYLRPSLVPPMIAAIIGLWVLRLWKLGLALGAALAALLMEIPGHPHYQAPFVPLYCLLLLLGFMALRAWKPRGRPFGLAFSRSLTLVFACATLMAMIGVACGVGIRALDGEFDCCGLNWPHPRDEIEAKLSSNSAKSLVLVRYGPYNFIHYEWVYNSADLAGAKIVWARDLGSDATRQLIGAFPGRDVWQLDVGMLPDGAPALRRYEVGVPLSLRPAR